MCYNKGYRKPWHDPKSDLNPYIELHEDILMAIEKVYTIINQAIAQKIYIKK